MGIYKIPHNWQDYYDQEIADLLMQKLEQVKTHKIYYCQNCGKEISSKKAKYCPSCSSFNQRICQRPEREILKNKIRTMPFTHIATEFHVSDNAIRKWCDGYNLPRKKIEINKISDEDWEKI